MTRTDKGKNLLIRKYHMTPATTKAVTYSSQIVVQFSFSKFNSLLSATSILSRSPMANSTTKTLDKLACADYVDFGKSQDRFGRFSWSKNDSNYLDFKLKVFKKEDEDADRLFGRKMEEEKFQQIVCVNCRLDEFLYLLDVMNSVYHKVIAYQSIRNVL